MQTQRSIHLNFLSFLLPSIFSQQSLLDPVRPSILKPDPTPQSKHPRFLPNLNPCRRPRCLRPRCLRPYCLRLPHLRPHHVQPKHSRCHVLHFRCLQSKHAWLQLTIMRQPAPHLPIRPTQYDQSKSRVSHHPAHHGQFRTRLSHV